MAWMMKGGLMLLFAGALVYASLEDHRHKRVRRYVWYVAGSFGFLMMAVCTLFPWGNGGISYVTMRAVNLGGLWDLFLFGLLQMLLFSKMYGRADCYAFVCCSLVLAAFGGRMVVFLQHMLIAVILLGIVQIFRGNIGKNGNLKRPVAFIPYISVAFFICITERILTVKLL